MEFDSIKVISLLMNRYGMAKSNVNASDNDIIMFNRIISMMECSQRVTYDLDFVDPFEEHDLYESDEEDFEALAIQPTSDISDYSMEEMQKIADAAEKWSLKSITHAWKHVKTYQQLKRIREIVEKGGRTSEKFEEIQDNVYEQFCEWKKERIVVHDSDLQLCALNVAKKLGMKDFKASVHWLHNFKKNHGITGRKITDYASPKVLVDEEHLQERAKEFVEEIRHLITKKCSPNVYNMDQSGINLEVVSGRTLEFKGTKRVLAMAQRPQAAHHSYSILPVLSIDGQLYPKLVVVLREPKPPQKFERELESFENLICYHSASGMFNSDLMVKFMKTFCDDKSVKPNSLILMDAWGGNDQSIKVAEKIHLVRRIPKKTTKYVQPEDLFFNRQFKNFLRKSSDKIRMFHNGFVLSIRKNIASLLSMAMYQFSAAKFESFLKFSWYKSGYSKNKSPFVPPPKYCFNIDPIDRTCELESFNCTEQAFIICAYCEKTVCMKHCIIEQHRCAQTL